MPGQESNHDVPNSINDPNIGQFILNLSVKVVGAAGTEFANDFLELGLTLDKSRNVNRVSFNTSRPGEFPPGYIDDIKAAVPEVLLGVIFGAMDDSGCPDDIKNYNSGLG